jgi:cell wall-associated NlpC family hydrolase
MQKTQIRRLRAPLVALVLCAALAPLASFADSEAAAAPAPVAVTESPSFAAKVTAGVQSAADRVVDTTREVTESALGLIGVRYKFGGESPEKGLDCSGLVRYVFEQVTGVTLPRSAREQARVGETVAMEELQPGDLVFFNTRRAKFSHVGIYLGDNRFVHAPHKRSKVKVANIEGQYWKKRFNGARRLVGILPGMVSLDAAKAVLGALPQPEDEPEDP